MSTGIEARHTRSCASRSGGRCNCTPTWQASAYDARVGRKVRRTFPNKTAAKQWRADAIVALHRGELSADRGPTLTQFAEQGLDGCRAGHYATRSGDSFKPSALRAYEKNLRLCVLPALGHMRLREITPRDVQRMLDGLVRDGLAPGTIDSALTPLRAMFRFARVRGMATTNPTAGLEKPAVRSKRDHIVPPAVAADTIDTLPAGLRALWATAFYAGLRRGELVALRWSDVDLAGGTISVRRGWDPVDGEITPKSRRGTRSVPIPAALRDYLVEHRLSGDGDGRMFALDRDVRRDAEHAARVWRAAGLPVLTLHEARHT